MGVRGRVVFGLVEYVRWESNTTIRVYEDGERAEAVAARLNRREDEWGDDHGFVVVPVKLRYVTC